jgi:hypothetical protein
MLTIAAGATAAGAGTYWATSGSSYDAAVEATWQMRPATGDPDLSYLVHYARLAANSHNSQPWQFSRSGKGVAIEPDGQRMLPVADPDNHHLYASLGCAAENLMLAAKDAGKSAAAHFVVDGNGRIEIDIAGTASNRDPLFDAILERQCTRSDYDGRAVNNDDLASIVNAAKIDGCEILLIPEKARIEQALEMIMAANKSQVENAMFAAELKSWIRFSSASAVASHDGLYAACSGNPVLPSWLGNLMFDFVYKADAENDRTARQIRSSSGLAVFVTDKDDRDHWMRAGRCYQRFALKSTMLGIRHAFMNQPVEIASARSEFSSWLGINGKRPDLVVRYGYGQPMPKSLRRPVEDVIVAS